jgi:hypothetical protein
MRANTWAFDAATGSGEPSPDLAVAPLVVPIENRTRVSGVVELGHVLLLVLDPTQADPASPPSPGLPTAVTDLTVTCSRHLTWSTRV